MAAKKIRHQSLLMFPAIAIMMTSCTRKNIDFGAELANSYTNLALVDTVGLSLSTVVSDSFETGGATSLLVGNYKDPYLGKISAKPFFQLGIPASPTTLPVTAQYDSLSLIIHFNKYFYGDTSRSQTIIVNEIAEPIINDVDNKLYNTSDFPVKSPALGSLNLRISPAAGDSVGIRLSDAKGMELFSKIADGSLDVTDANSFLYYFRGISLSTNSNDTTAIYGVKGDAGSIIMRLYYHSTTPFPTPAYIDFASLANPLAFDQIKADRSATGLSVIPGPNGTTETSATLTHDVSFLQAGSGVQLKITFPSLRDILATDKIVRLLKAELILRPTYGSFDRNRYPLPDPVFLQLTDGSNIAGATVTDSTGSNIQNSSPVIDDLYGENTYYRFNVTTYINQLLTTAGETDKGVYVMNKSSSADMNVTRLILNNSLHDRQSSQLLLSVLIINK